MGKPVTKVIVKQVHVPHTIERFPMGEDGRWPYEIETPEHTRLEIEIPPTAIYVSTMAGGPAGGGWHYPSETFYEDQSHIIRGEN